jgi:O-antigen/teichoic acid export membrane protein
MVLERRLWEAVFARRALRQAAAVLIDQGFLSLASFATGALLARVTDKEGYSMYVLGLSLVLILQGLHRALVGVPFTVHAPALAEQERNTYQGSALAHTIILGAIVLLPLLMAGTIHDGVQPALARLFPWVGIVTVALFLREFARGALLARLQFWAGVSVSMVATFIQLALTAWLFARHALTPASTFAVMAATSAVAGAYMFWADQSHVTVIFARLWPDFVRSLTTGKWVLIDAFAYMAASQAYPWLLLYLADARSVAAFGVCSAFAGLTGPLVRGAGSYIHPRLVHGYKGGNASNLLRLVRLAVLALTIPLVAWLLTGGLLSDYLLSLIYGNSYSGYALLATLLLMRAAIEGVSTPVSQALQTVQRADAVTVSLLLGAVVSLALGSILVIHVGLTGAGVAAVASSALTALWRWLMLRKLLHAAAERRPYSADPKYP